MDSIYFSEGAFLLVHPTFLDPNSTNLGKARIGRKHYSSPELWEQFLECTADEEVDNIPSYLDTWAADVYSLALVVLELAAMDEAATFHDKNSEAVENRLLVLKAERSAALLSLVEGMMAKESLRVGAAWVCKQSKLEHSKCLDALPNINFELSESAMSPIISPTERKRTFMKEEEASNREMNGEDSDQENENVTENDTDDDIVEREYADSHRDDHEMLQRLDTVQPKSEGDQVDDEIGEKFDSPITIKSQSPGNSQLRRNKGERDLSKEKVKEFIPVLQVVPSQSGSAVTSPSKTSPPVPIQESPSPEQAVSTPREIEPTKIINQPTAQSSNLSSAELPPRPHNPLQTRLAPPVPATQMQYFTTSSQLQPTSTWTSFIRESPPPSNNQNVRFVSTPEKNPIAERLIPEGRPGRVLDVKRYVYMEGQKIPLPDGVPVDVAIRQLSPLPAPSQTLSTSQGPSERTYTYGSYPVPVQTIVQKESAPIVTSSHFRRVTQTSTFLPASQVQSPPTYQYYTSTQQSAGFMAPTAPAPAYFSVYGQPAMPSQTIVVDHQTPSSPERRIHSLTRMSQAADASPRNNIPQSEIRELRGTDTKKDEADWSFAESAFRVSKGEDILDPMHRSRNKPSIERIKIEDDREFPRFLLEYNRNHSDDEEPINEPDPMHNCRQCHMKQIRTGKPNVHCKKHKAQAPEKKSTTKPKKKVTKKKPSFSPDMSSPRSEMQSKKEFDVREFTVTSKRDQMTSLCADPICPKYYESLNPSRTHKNSNFCQKLAEIEQKAKANKERLAREEADFKDRRLADYAQKQLEQWRQQQTLEAGAAGEV